MRTVARARCERDMRGLPVIRRRVPEHRESGFPGQSCRILRQQRLAHATGMKQFVCTALEARVAEKRQSDDANLLSGNTFCLTVLPLSGKSGSSTQLS